MSTENAIAAANAFNSRAEKNGWPTFCDSRLAFRSPELADLHRMWSEKAGGGIPKRKDFTHRSLKAQLPDVAIYQRVANPSAERRYRVRLIGTRFADVMGELTGRYLDEAIPAEFLPRWYAALDTAFDANAPLRFMSRADTSSKNFLVGEYFEAPLLAEDGEPGMILAASHFSAARSWSDTWAAERPNAANWDDPSF